MDAETAKAALRDERLKQLQMEDLGSARREYISTSDIKKRKNTSLQYLEANRMSNMRGSEAQRTAEANKDKLAGWANVYKDIGDTEDLENLDSLLEGQTHRSQLNAFIRESGGQSYTQEASKGKAASKVAPKPSKYVVKLPDVTVSKNHQRTGTSRSATSARDTSKEAFTKHPPLARKPSLNIPRRAASNYQKTREVNDQKNIPSRAVSGPKKPPASLRTRRPAPEFVGLVSSPESFLAAARSVYDPKRVQPTVAGGSASNENSGEKSPSDVKQPPQKKLRTSLGESVHRPPDDSKPHPKPSPVQTEKPAPPGLASSLDHSIHRAQYIKAPTSQKMPSITLGNSNQRAQDSKAPTSEKKPSTSLDGSIHKAKDNSTTHLKQAPGLVLKHPAKELATPLNRSIHSPKDASASDSKAPSKVPERPPQNESKSPLCRSSGNIKDKTASHPKALPESATESLIKGLITSVVPSIQTVQSGNAASAGTPRPVMHPEPKIASKSSEVENIKPSMPATEPKIPLKSSTHPQNKISSAKSTQEKLGVLLDFNVTPTKSSTQNGNKDYPIMSPSIEDLKGLDFAGPSPSPQTQTPEQEQPFATPKRRLDFRAVSTEVKGSSEPVENDIQPTSGEDFQANIEMLCKLLESTSLSEKQRETLQECKDELQSKLSSDPQTPTPARSGIQKPQSAVLSPQSRLNVAAAAFVPKGSFANHRSPTRSISSDSTQYAASVKTELPAEQPGEQPTEQPVTEHIYGNHLLPGRRGRMEEQPVNSAVNFNIPTSKSFRPKLTHPASTGYQPPPVSTDSKADIPTDSIIFRPRAASKPVRITSRDGNQLQKSIHASFPHTGSC